MLLCADDHDIAVQEARLLHLAGDPGYFCIGHKIPDAPPPRNWAQKCLPRYLLDEAVAATRNQPDTYISQASFVAPRRTVSCAKLLRCTFIDLDCYKLGIRPDEATMEAVLQIAAAAGLPEPSYMTCSGQGLYAKWVFEHPITSDLLPQWRMLQETLIHLYRSLGCDPKVRDAARVLRLPSTVNRANGSVVRIARPTGKLYNFAALCKAVAHVQLPAVLESARSKGSSLRRQHASVDLENIPMDFQALTNYSTMREPLFMRHGSLQALNWNRFLDLRDLIFKRQGIRKGERDITVFWMTSFLAQARVITPTNLWDEIGQLLSAFPVGPDFNPVAEGSLSSLIERIKSADAGQKVQYRGSSYTPVYSPSSDTLIDMLEITPDEEREMRTIISATEKRRRADAKAPGRAERRSERQELRQAAVALKAEGHSVAEIAAKLGKDRSTVHRWLEPAQGVGQEVVERRGRRSSRAGKAEGVPPAQAPMTPAELARRTRVRSEKEHLAGAQWEPERLQAWLAQREQRARQKALILEETLQRDEQLAQARVAQAGLQTQILLSGIRDRVAGKAPPISNLPPDSLSSGNT